MSASQSHSQSKRTKNEGSKSKYLGMFETLKQNLDFVGDNERGEMMDEIRKESSTLLASVSTTYELKLDALVVNETTKQSEGQLAKRIGARVMSTGEFVNALVQRSMYEDIDLYFGKVHGIFLGVKFCDGLDFDFLPKQVKRNPPKPKAEEKLVENANVPQRVTSKDEEMSTNLDKLISKVDELGKVPFYTLVLNRHSFSRTVENIFYLSMGVKDRKFGIQKEGETFYVVKNTREVDLNETQTHLIFNLTLGEYEELVRALEQR